MTNHNNITEQDKQLIEKYYELPLADIDIATYKKKQRELRAKYHPDNFEKFDDDTIQEMATERFQQIERISQLLENFLKGQATLTNNKEQTTKFTADAKFSANGLRLELITQDKKFKYNLFGTHYKWLVIGDKYIIPNTNASIIMEEDHSGFAIGYTETVRLFLSFDIHDSIDEIVNWLYPRIKDKVSTLLIAKKEVSINPMAMKFAIQNKTILQIQ